MEALKYVHIDGIRTESGKAISLELSYQTFGQPLHEAPVVLVIQIWDFESASDFVLRILSLARTAQQRL